MIDALRNVLRTPATRTVALVFALNSFLLANFFARLPAVQGGLGLGHGELGLALTGLSAGSIAAMLAAGRLVALHGSGPVTWWATLALCLVSPLPVLAGSAEGLGAALTLFGLVNGAVAVAVNTEATAVEARAGMSMMASFHAMFSLGGIIGAVTGTLAAGSGLSPPAHLALLGVVAALAALSRHGTLGSTPAGRRDVAAPALALPRGRLVGLALLAFGTMLCEGAASDWSALYIANSLGAGPALAGLGYACFAAGMAIGRLYGDTLLGRFGEVRVISGGASLAAFGFGLGLLPTYPLAAVLGFGCLGVGLAGISPILFRAAAATPGTVPGVGIAAVASIGFTGFLAGPAVIGLVAEHVDLGIALAILPALALGVALAAGPVLGTRLAGPEATPSPLAVQAA